ncbi:uncharacterized protein LOC143007947 [Genypterus blacodes]|uniref:uncharacterized protein LOC143007947 n=1 Tax=Genypterus blacodes TaxID=154954 RepID=UPI003F7767A9
MECHDRYFMIAVDLSFTGNEPRFEAIDKTGVYPITEQYGAECGYKVSVFPVPPLVTLQASYFSCHTDNKEDKMFTFNFNLIGTHEGEEVTYALNKTCSPSLPWSAREVICEVNYMEVNVQSDLACPMGTRKEDWNSTLKTAYASATSDWQVMFHQDEMPLTPVTLSEARNKGYVFDLTEGRLIFRSPYGQPESISTIVNNVPVELIHPTLFSRQSWVVLMIDLMAACSMHEGAYDGSFLLWEAPQARYLLSGLNAMQVNAGLNGELWEQLIAEEKGYIVQTQGSAVNISIPYDAEGSFKKSIVTDRLYEFYVYDLYMDQLLVDQDDIYTRIYSHRVLTTPLLQSSIVTENRTVLEDEAFTVYLEVADDIELVSLHLNGKEFTVPFTNTSTSTIYEAAEPNGLHSYTLKVPFNDPVVKQQFSKQNSVLQFSLHLDFTLVVLPEGEPYRHTAYVEAVIMGISPPAFEAFCTETGISFKLDRQPFDYLWEICIGSEPLTPELANRLGYFMHRDDQKLLLDVPIFTYGFEYNDINLARFLGTFELLVWDHKMTEVHAAFAKTCPFPTNELIVCSTDGKLTVVADMSMAIPRGGIPAWTLRNETCGPKAVDGTRVLFSFRLNTCGTRIKLGKGNVTYENEIVAVEKSITGNRLAVSRNETDKVTVHCMYHLAGLHRLFSVYRFESDMDGLGSIVHTVPPTSGKCWPAGHHAAVEQNI